MTGNTIRLTNGQRWTAWPFLDHYRSARISGTPTPVGDAPAPVDVDRSWYMDEGPGRYYHPGMFPVINRIMANRNLAPGTYDLRDFVPDRNEKDPLLAAGLSNYTTDMRSSDHGLRSFVFGNESARISGQVVVNPDGSKMFKQIEIRPLDTNFDFEPNMDPTNNKVLEGVRAIARRIFDPSSRGVSYNIQYRGPGPGYGNGRLYDPFTDSQLGEALQKPAGRPPGLLPSITGKPPLPYVDEHRQYLDRVNGDKLQASTTGAPAVVVSPPTGPSSSDSDVASWIASLAGVNPTKPTQPAASPLNDDMRDFYRNDPAWLLQKRR